ncbi:c-type cytochrome [Silvimonas iriomotensis]|uniref:Cytochrome c-551 n=1 Tax=Silvimonas iriomotensis TaxID=449662 RepID=A0ABQ2PG06_9NEIS|nr:c-type cytochrome [Silvimonas iriomotensis]GGP24105.1 cytochrome c-551 [Silvimonas iriomotensis]
MLLRCVLLSSLLAMPVLAAEPQDLAKNKNCFACHGVDNKIVGPAWKDVAARFKGQKGAEKLLADKIKNGSSGTWGPIAMPPNPVTDAEASQLAKWILTRKY